MKQKDLKKYINQLMEIKDHISEENPDRDKLIEIIYGMQNSYKKSIKKDLKENFGKYFDILDYSFERCINEFRLEKCKNAILDANGNEYTLGDFINLIKTELWGETLIDFMNSYVTDIEYLLDVAIEYREELVNQYLKMHEEKEI